MRHVDASEPDAQGRYAYRYAYDLFTFVSGRVTYVARGYVSEPHDAHFLRAEEDGESRMLVSSDLTTASFVEAVQWLRANGKPTLAWLTDEGFVPLAR